MAAGMEGSLGSVADLDGMDEDSMADPKGSPAADPDGMAVDPGGTSVWGHAPAADLEGCIGEGHAPSVNPRRGRQWQWI